MKNPKKKSSDIIEIVAIRITRFIGSTNSIIIHTIAFIGSFVLYFLGVSLDKILLIVTTIVSLEAIYLSIFIQMSVNRQARKLHLVARDVEEIQEDVEEIEKDVDEIQKDVDEIQEDVEDIQEDVEDIQEDDKSEELEQKKDDELMQKIEKSLDTLVAEMVELKNQTKQKRERATHKI